MLIDEEIFFSLFDPCDLVDQTFTASSQMTAMKVITLLTSSYFASTLSFSPRNLSPRVTRSINQIKPPLLQVKGSSSESEEPIDATVIERLEELTPEQKEQVGNLVADEEWAGMCGSDYGYFS